MKREYSYESPVRTTRHNSLEHQSSNKPVRSNQKDLLNGFSKMFDQTKMKIQNQRKEQP